MDQCDLRVCMGGHRLASTVHSLLWFYSSVQHSMPFLNLIFA